MRYKRLIIRFIILILTLSVHARLSAEEAVSADEQFLRSASIDPDGEGLIRFFRKRSLTAPDKAKLQSAIRRLGSQAFKVRTDASSEIIALGLPALPCLRLALQDTDPEIGRRAQACIVEIGRQHDAGAALPSAAARLLAQRKLPGAVDALILYLPFNDDEGVEEEILTALRSLASGGTDSHHASAALLPVLKDPVAPRRAAAAYVLGRSTDPAERTAVHELLGDIDPGVRFRAAQGLLAGKDKAAVPALVALVGDAPPGLVWKVEDMLRRIAGRHAPNASMGDGSLQARQKYRDAWAAWWRDHAQTVDLAGIDDGRHHLGFTLVAEMDSNKVWEFGLDGKPRWKVDHLQGPMDAQILPGDHVLIAEYQGRCVTERDQQGKIHWRKEINGSPITCQRLPNGNTFIATHNSFMEITPQGKELYSRTPGAGLFVFGAQKMANGNIACVANPGIIQEIDPVANKSVKSIRLDNNFGGWCGVEALPGGRFLIAVLGSGKVQELDSAGKAIWECTVPGACHATRLPNGHVLVACMANRRVVEVDREGKTIKETLTEGRPWRVHQR